MRDRKKRNIIIGALCCLLVFMGVGYSLAQQLLEIKGTAGITGNWNIYIESIAVKSKSDTAVSKSVSLNDTRDIASFEVELLVPGDYVEYEFVVTNDGNIDAVLRKLEPTIDTNTMDIMLTHSIMQGQLLKNGTSTTFTLKVRFDERATEITEGGLATFDIKMLYEQYTGDMSGVEEGVVPVTANDCFKISNEGVIYDYDYSCGTSVTIPQVVNKIEVASIDGMAFKDANLTLFFKPDNTEIPYLVVAKDETAYNRGMQLLEAMGVTSVLAYIEGDPQIDDEITDDLIPEKMNVTESLSLQYAYDLPSKVEYLDLSQATGLEKVEAYSFSSTSDTKTLKYLNLDGVPVEGISASAFSYSDLEYLTVDTDLYNSTVGEVDEFGVGTLRILKGENSSEITSVNHSGKGSINSLIIGEGITKIGDSAVFSNRGITNVELPSTLTYIGNSAFSNNSLTTLVLPEQVKTIGNYAFANNQISDDGNSDSPETQYWFKHVEKIGIGAFKNNSFVDVRFYAGITEIGNSAFEGNTSMTSVRFNEDRWWQWYKGEIEPILVSVGDSAFRGNGISEATLLGLKDIGDYAFEGNALVASSAWSSGSMVETIGEQAFANNPSFSDASGGYVFGVGCNIKSIASSAFLNTGTQLNLVVPKNSTVTFRGNTAVSQAEAQLIDGVKFYYDPSKVCN